MPDPALLAVLQHFASPPPAIVQPSEIVDGEPFISALETMADQKDREFEAWAREAVSVRERMRLAVRARPQDFPREMFDDLIARFERFVGWEIRAAAKRDRLWRRRRASDRLRALQDRTSSRDRRRLVAADDLVMFLRAMRAEADPDTRGGPVFSDPDELERHILGSAA